MIQLAILCVCFFSGAASLVYELVWMRHLTLVFGATTYAISTILSIFMGGLALGSLAFGLLEISVGLGFLLSAVLFDDLLAHSQRLLEGEIESFGGSVRALVARTSLVLLLPSIFLGATLPIATVIRASTDRRVGRTVGSVYAVNTIGAISGSLALTFVLVPVIGMQQSLLLLLAANLALGTALLAAHVREPLPRAVTVAALGIVTVLALSLVPRDLFTRTFIAGPDQRLVYYAEGATDTVGVVAYANGQRGIRYADLRGTAGTHSFPWNYVLGHLPFLLHPGEPEQALNICFGVGNSLSAMAVHESLVEIDNVELSPHALEAADFFWTNDGISRHEKVNYITDDGRNFVMASEKTYDIIELEPPMTYTSGVIHLYTREFYEDLLDRLAPDGVVLQWVPIAQGTLQEEKTLFRSFYEVFPYSTAWRLVTEGAPILLIGTKRTQTIDYGLLAEKMARPRVRRDLELAGIRDVEDVLFPFILDHAGMGEFVEGVRPVVDDRTVLDFSMPRFIGSGSGTGFLSGGPGAGQRRQDVILERSRLYDRKRRSVLPYLTHLGDRTREDIERSLRSRTVPSGLSLFGNIPEHEWDRWPDDDPGA